MLILTRGIYADFGPWEDIRVSLFYHFKGNGMKLGHDLKKRAEIKIL